MKLKTYVIGFLLSLTLTLTGFAFVQDHVQNQHAVFSHRMLVPLIMVLAITQLFVQLYFFLHLGREPKPRWKLVAFLLAVGVILILVIGSLWIMYNLNYNMTPQEINKYMNSQDGL